MGFEKYTFDELDIELAFYVRDELKKKIGDRATEVLMESTFLQRLQSDPLYVHHYDEKYWADQIYLDYQGVEK